MKRETFIRKRNQFRRKLEDILALPEREQDWDAFGEWLVWDCIVTCRTEGCRNEGKSHWLKVSEASDNVYRVLCAGCMQAISDIDPVLEDDSEFRLNMLMEDGTPGVRGVLPGKEREESLSERGTAVRKRPGNPGDRNKRPEDRGEDPRKPERPEPGDRGNLRGDR